MAKSEVDYSQIELRIMAHLSDDVHRAIAAEVFGVTPNEVSKEQRRAAKAINFGLMYGISAIDSWAQGNRV